ncbi:MAG: sporulation integral membrane protein YtvI [Erysipelotrichaceae bacterium]|nr:sporulation integral membrane protein YtvI [Erysipelotrichaceae bacterium]
MDTKYEMKKKFIVNTIYIVIVTLLGYLLFKYVVGFISPFIFAFLIARILQKPAKYISQKIKIKTSIIALLLAFIFYAIIIVLFSLLGAKIFSVITSVVSDIPNIYKTYITPIFNSIFDFLERTVYGLDPTVVDILNSGFEQLIGSLQDNITNFSITIVSSLSNIATSLPSFIIKILLMIISTFFIASDYDRIIKFINKQLSPKAYEAVNMIKDYVFNTLFEVIKSYVTIMTITFIELSIGLTILRVSNSISIAILISIFDILPVLGTGGIMIPWLIISFIQGNVKLGFGLLIVYVIVTLIRNIIEPKIVGSQLGLHPIVTLLSMFIGTSLFGGIGLFGFPIFLSLLKYLNDKGTISILK